MFDFLSYSIFEISIQDVLIVLLFVFLGLMADKFSLWLINLLLKHYQLHKEFLRKQQEEEEEARKSGEYPEADKDGPTKSRPSLLSLKTIQNFSKGIEALKKPLHVFCVTVGCSLGLTIMKTPSWGEEFFKIITTALEAISTWCLIWFLLNLIKSVFTPIALEKAKNNGIHLGEMLVPILMSILRGILMIIGVLFVAQNMGYSISSLLAGLGLGGAAIALASKDTLSNVFGSFVILFDQPFDIGDWVTIDGISGTVEDISMRSTKIRTFDDTVVVIPNQLLTTTKIDRRGKVKTKMDCNFGVLYSTTVDQLRTIVTNIENYIETHPDEFITNKHYVHFNEFGAASLNVTVVAYTNQTKYKEHVKLKQEFMFAIMNIVREAGTEFAFPTQTLDFPKEPIQIAISHESDDSKVS
ncbi:MAG: mechanosensitive ion channel family protein [Proteobacteria bacterium]|nr:mechanosensitive ion channel family protein [Pseudomonadota bacterium]